MLELQPAARAEDQHPPVIGRALREQQIGHPVRIRGAGHLPRRPFAVSRDRVRIGERARRALDAAIG
jgi:hypothetical protein